MVRSLQWDVAVFEGLSAAAGRGAERHDLGAGRRTHVVEALDLLHRLVVLGAPHAGAGPHFEARQGIGHQRRLVREALHNLQTAAGGEALHGSTVAVAHPYVELQELDVAGTDTRSRLVRRGASM